MRDRGQSGWPLRLITQLVLRVAISSYGGFDCTRPLCLYAPCVGEVWGDVVWVEEVLSVLMDFSLFLWL